MTKRIKIEPDTQEAREEVFMAVANRIHGAASHPLLPNSRIELEFNPHPGRRPSIIVSLNGIERYAPYLELFEEIIAETRSGIRFTLSDD